MHLFLRSLVVAAWTAPAALIGLQTAARAQGTQSHVVGRWIVRYERDAAGMHDTSPRLVIDSASMALVQRGDSILGEWKSIAANSDPRSRGRELRGLLRRDTVRLQFDPSVAESEGFFSEMGREIVEFLKEHIHGIPPMTKVLEFTMRGDSLIGTRWSASPDYSTETPRHPMWAIREKP
jgi:hypothetical protein